MVVRPAPSLRWPCLPRMYTLFQSQVDFLELSLFKVAPAIWKRHCWRPLLGEAVICSGCSMRRTRKRSQCKHRKWVALSINTKRSYFRKRSTFFSLILKAKMCRYEGKSVVYWRFPSTRAGHVRKQKMIYYCRAYKTLRSCKDKIGARGFLRISDRIRYAYCMENFMPHIFSEEWFPAINVILTCSMQPVRKKKILK